MRKNKGCMFVFAFIILISVFLFSGCDTKVDDNKNVFTNTADIVYTCNYDTATDSTKIIFSMPLENKSVYTITKLVVCFDVYNNDVYTRTVGEIEYNYKLQYGKAEAFKGRWTAYGEVDKIKLNYFHVEQQNLWRTYEGWWIAAIVFASLLVLTAVIIIIVKDVEIDDFFDWIKEEVLVNLLALASGVIPAIVAFFTGAWVAGLIILGGLIAAFVCIMITFLIKYLVEGF